ncbi:hypothetical protein ACFWPK_17885 [Nocardia sp. NPDC058519]|uniref:hypothetical protein n=1 Tax=Nocardia sp. NPDC058519 TaxID=3346535 RepID=UPI00365E26D3
MGRRSMTGPAKAKHWGLLVGETVHPLPKARGAADAYIASGKDRRDTEVVYRHNTTDPWLTFTRDHEVPTQLEFDWNAA